MNYELAATCPFCYLAVRDTKGRFNTTESRLAQSELSGFFYNHLYKAITQEELEQTLRREGVYWMVTKDCVAVLASSKAKLKDGTKQALTDYLLRIA